MRPACTVRPAQPAPRGHQFAPPAPHQAVVCEAGRPGGMRSARSNLIDHTDFCNKSTPQSTKVPLQSTIQPFVSHCSPTDVAQSSLRTFVFMGKRKRRTSPGPLFPPILQFPVPVGKWCQARGRRGPWFHQNHFWLRGYSLCLCGHHGRGGCHTGG